MRGGPAEDGRQGLAPLKTSHVDGHVHSLECAHEKYSAKFKFSTALPAACTRDAVHLPDYFVSLLHVRIVAGHEASAANCRNRRLLGRAF